jgi:hypothetical protein
MMTRAHVLTPNNNTMASSMLESLRWCCGSMRARREIVIIQHGGDAPTKPFSGFDEHIPNKGPCYSLPRPLVSDCVYEPSPVTMRLSTSSNLPCR